MVFAAAAAVLVPGAAHADALQNRVLAAARATPADGVSFRRSTRIEQSGKPAKTVVESYDPRRAADARWVLETVDGRAPTQKELADARKLKRGDTPSYAEIARWFGSPATVVPQARGRVLYRFARLPKGVLKIGSFDASANVAAEAVVNNSVRNPYVESVRFRSAKGFRIMLVAKVDQFAATGRYRPLANGLVVPEGGTSDMTGSIVGRSGTLKVTVDYSEQRAVR